MPLTSATAASLVEGSERSLALGNSYSSISPRFRAAVPRCGKGGYILMCASRVLLAVLERLVRDRDLRDYEACVRAGVDPLTHTRCPFCQCRDEVDLDCTHCGGCGFVEVPF